MPSGQITSTLETQLSAGSPTGDMIVRWIDSAPNSVVLVMKGQPESIGLTLEDARTLRDILSRLDADIGRFNAARAEAKAAREEAKRAKEEAEKDDDGD